VALFYFLPVFAHNFVFACTWCDAKHNPPVRLKLCGHPLLLSSSFSLRLAFFFCLPPPLLRFSSLLFRLASTFGLLALSSLRLALFLFLVSTLFGFP